MNENNHNLETRPTGAKSGTKARWSLTCALKKCNLHGDTTANLVVKVRDDWPAEFDGRVGYGRIMAALNYMKIVGQAERIAQSQWRFVDSQEQQTPLQYRSDSPASPQNEERYYPMVAEQLFGGYARIIGGAIGPGKFKTPDVVGVVEPNEIAKVNGFSAKLVAVEVKDATDANSLFTGFAQSCAYQGFAHMAYLVVPWCDNENIDRIIRLCRANGVGVAFIIASEDGSNDEGGGEWLEIQVPPRSQEPDPDQFEEFLNRLDIVKIETLCRSE